MQSVRQLLKVGVAVMRVQVPDLHAGHRYVIDHMSRVHSRSLIVLGYHGGMPTDRDPLTVEERTEMIRESYKDPNLKIVSLRDHPFSHDRWSVWLDELVKKEFGEECQANMYGGAHDSFLDTYTGKFTKVPLTRFDESSGTAQRAAIVRSAGMSARERMIHFQIHRYPIAYSAEDVAIVDDQNERVLGIMKHWFDGRWSLPGGFLDPEKDIDDEAGARRERREELLGIKTTDVYLQLGKRIRVDDPRYRGSKDKIYTTLFANQYRSGTAVGGDDAKGARWFNRNELRSMFVPWHLPLVERLEERWDILRSGRIDAA